MLRLSLLSAFALIPAHAMAQDTPPAQNTPPAEAQQRSPFNPDHWQKVTSDDGTFALVHKMSGAICLDNFRDLRLSDVTSYTTDGTDVSCSFSAGAGKQQVKLTTYFFKKPGLTGAMAFKQARNQIDQMAQVSALTAAHNKDHSRRCYEAMTPRVGAEVLKRLSAQSSEPVEAGFAMGVAMFDFTQGSGFQQTSLLTVYELGGWIMKARVTLPAAADASDPASYAAACNYAGLSNEANARQVKFSQTGQEKD